MEFLSTLTTVGAPGLVIMIGALLWDRKEIKADLKAERAKTELMVDRLISLALEDDVNPPCPELRKAQRQNHGSVEP